MIDVILGVFGTAFLVIFSFMVLSILEELSDGREEK